MTMVKNHFETVIITAYIAKQEITIQTKKGENYRGKIQKKMTEDGFYVNEGFIAWDELNSIDLEEEYFHFWQEIVKQAIE